MPKGDNPNSRKNLRPFKKGETVDQQRKGAAASVAARKEYKTFQECFKDRMTTEERDALYDVLVKRARQGNLKAFEILRDTLGEKPTDTVVVSSVNMEAVDRLHDAIKKRQTDGTT